MQNKIKNIAKAFEGKFDDTFLKVDQSSISKPIILLLFTITMIALMLHLNHLTPWVADDILKIEIVKQFTFKQHLSHLWDFYFSWGGRIWGEFFACLFLSVPKRLFDVINTLGYFLLVGLLYFNIVGKIKFSPSLFVVINFLLAACLPAFGQDILWVSGAANYMWLSLIPLLYMLFWRIYLHKEKKWMNSVPALILLMGIGVLAGWSNENVSVSLILLAAGYIWLYREKYSVIPLFAKTGIGALIIGSSSFGWHREISCVLLLKNIQNLFFRC